MNSIEKRFTEASTVVNNVSNPSIKTPMLSFGVKQKFIDKCSSKKDEVGHLINVQIKEKHEMSIAYDNFQREQEKCNKKYLNIQKMVKLCTRHNDEVSSRVITSIIPLHPIKDWFGRVSNFYIKIASEPTIMEYLEMFNITAKTLSIYSEELHNAQHLREVAIKEKGEAENATDKRNRAMAELEDMCYELITLAKIALQDSPQLLEQLGVVVK